jgi:hypothetical protein
MVALDVLVAVGVRSDVSSVDSEVGLFPGLLQLSLGCGLILSIDLDLGLERGARSMDISVHCVFQATSYRMRRISHVGVAFLLVSAIRLAQHNEFIFAGQQTSLSELLQLHR